MALDIRAIKDEILNFLRDKLNSTDPLNRVVVQTTTVTATAGQTLFTLSPTLLSFVRSVTVDATSQSLGTNYNILWRDANKGKVQFTSALSGGEIVVITWGKALNGNFVYGDYPRTDLGESTYPRIGFNVLTRARVAGLGGGVNYPMAYNLNLSVKIVHTNPVFLDEMEKTLTDVIEQNAKNFYTFRFINPETLGNYNLDEDPAGNTLSKVLDFAIPDQYRTITYA